MRNKTVPFETLLGMVLTAVETDNDNEPQKIKFTTSTGRRFVMHHHQDCCESVYVESIVGDLKDLLEYPILQAEEAQNPDEAPDSNPAISEYESGTWTFYKLATVRGYVTIRWLGTSNGYYSESVDFEEILK